MALKQQIVNVTINILQMSFQDIKEKIPRAPDGAGKESENKLTLTSEAALGGCDDGSGVVGYQF